MTDSVKTPWPTELRLRPGGQILAVAFDNGERYELDAEYLRVESPSAEVQGHSPTQRQWPAGKKDVAIREINPVGNYAAKLVFSDGHSTGIYSWTELRRLGRERDKLWPEYLAELKKRGLRREP
jgi:DUF971 family protein